MNELWMENKQPSPPAAVSCSMCVNVLFPFMYQNGTIHIPKRKRVENCFSAFQLDGQRHLHVHLLCRRVESTPDVKCVVGKHDMWR